ncbi:MAG: hypothetical protein OXG56_01480, partial [Gammaproteobacteria bacterium]|nr:hypothetical protein [Gammaproteobacteria bacterium]
RGPGAGKSGGNPQKPVQRKTLAPILICIYGVEKGKIPLPFLIWYSACTQTGNKTQRNSLI